MAMLFLLPSPKLTLQYLDKANLLFIIETSALVVGLLFLNFNYLKEQYSSLVFHILIIEYFLRENFI